MKTHTDQNVSLASGEVLRLAPRRLELSVVAGTVWLTRRGDAADHLLRPGQRFELGGGDRAVIESWLPGPAAVVRLRSTGTPLHRLAMLLRTLGRLLHNGAALFDPEPACSTTFPRPSARPCARN